jgi:tetratricopeptide (TPR) repeat protein
MWSETYDRQLSDLFKIQDEISVAVVNALHAALLNASAPTISRASTMDAYLLYLRASASYRLHTPQDNDNAIATIRQCLALDGDYAPAWALLARSLGADYGLFGRGAYAEVSAKMREAAQRAVTLDRKLPDAYLALARSYLLDWRWDEANEAIQNALALEPENSDALSLASSVPEYRGQSDAALRFAGAALIRDPLDFENYNRLADLQMMAGRFGEARTAYRRSYELNPSQDRLHQTLGDLLLANGNPVGALDEYQQEPEEMFRLIGRVNALDALGRRVEADTDLAILKEKYSNVSPFSIAGVYASRGDFDRAFQWLDRAVQMHDGSIAYLRVMPDFQALRKDPRFEALLHAMHLDQ